MINISEPFTDHLELRNIKKILKSKRFTDAHFQKNCEPLEQYIKFRHQVCMPVRSIDCKN